MTLAAVIDDVKDTIKDLFKTRDAMIRELADVEAQAEVEARALVIDRDAAQAKVDAIEAPYKELERAQEAIYNHGLRVERAKAEKRNWLQDHPTDELARFRALLDRLTAKIRTMDGPSANEKINYITSARTVTNLPELERWHNAVSGKPDPERPDRRLPSALAQAQRACHDELWRLPPAAQRPRIAELRRAIEESFAGTVLENELG